MFGFDENVTPEVRNQWKIEARHIVSQARKQSRVAESSDKCNVICNGAIVINYEVNVDSFYFGLLKRLNSIQLDLQRVTDKSKRKSHGQKMI